MRLLAASLFVCFLMHPSFAVTDKKKDKKSLVNGTAAVVGKVLITVQDAYFYRALQRFREGSDNPLTVEEGDALKKTVQRMIFEEMVLAEMKSFQLNEGAKGEAQKLIQKERTAGKERLWRNLLGRFGKLESAAVDRLSKSLQVEKFIQKKVETLTPIITDAEVEKYYKQNQGRFQGSNLETWKPNIILLLKKQRMEKGLEEWVRFLSDKYGATNYLEG